MFLPIVQRELRVAARRRNTYWIRLAAALAALVVSAWICFSPGYAATQPALGKTLFSALSLMAMAYCLLIGPFITADCISEEKREGTLGLLFLTELRSYDVVFGKWAAASLAALYGLLAILPWLGLPLLLGGVTPGEYGRVALAIVNAILFSLTAGIFVSALSREQSKAMLGAFILILGLSGILPGLVVFVMKGLLGMGLGTFPPIALASPISTGRLALESMYRANPANPKLYWISLGIVHGACWLFMLATVFIVPRVWRKSPGENPKPRRWLLRLGRTKRWQRRLTRRLDKNPVFAIASRHRWPHWVFWTLVALVGVNVYWLSYGARLHPETYQFHLQFGHALYFINRVWIATMACRFILEARRNGALELLLTSPLSAKQLLRGHWQALARLFFWPVVVIALLHVFYVWAATPSMRSTLPPGTNAASLAAMNQSVMSQLKINTIAATGSFVSFFADIFALSLVSVWLTVASKRTTFVVLKAFVFVILIPWTLFYLLTYTRIWVTASIMHYYTLRPIVWVTKDILFVAWAWWKIRRHFRAAAAQTYHPWLWGSRS